MKHISTFMNIPIEYDPVKDRNESQHKAELGYLTGRGYWLGLRASWSNMDNIDKKQEYNNIA